MLKYEMVEDKDLQHMPGHDIFDIRWAVQKLPIYERKDHDEINYHG